MFWSRHDWTLRCSVDYKMQDCLSPTLSTHLVPKRKVASRAANFTMPAGLHIDSLHTACHWRSILLSNTRYSLAQSWANSTIQCHHLTNWPAKCSLKRASVTSWNMLHSPRALLERLCGLSSARVKLMLYCCSSFTNHLRTSWRRSLRRRGLESKGYCQASRCSTSSRCKFPKLTI